VLLTPAEITSTTGNRFQGYPSGPVEVINSSLGTSDNTFSIDPADCAGVIFGAEQQTYADTGYEAIRDQTLGQTTSDIDNLVEQTVAVFSTPAQAQALLESSTTRWQECASGHPTKYQSESSVDQDTGYEKGWGWYLTHVRVGNELITMQMTAVNNESGGAPACQVALGVRDNVVVTAKTCLNTDAGPHRPDPSLAGDYAQRLTTTMLDKVQV
jgi:hypothetical protein